MHMPQEGQEGLVVRKLALSISLVKCIDVKSWWRDKMSRIYLYTSKLPRAQRHLLIVHLGNDVGEVSRWREIRPARCERCVSQDVNV